MMMSMFASRSEACSARAAYEPVVPGLNDGP